MAEGDQSEAGQPAAAVSPEMQAYLERIEARQNETMQGISYLAQVQAQQAQQLAQPAAPPNPRSQPDVWQRQNEQVRTAFWDEPLNVLAQYSQIQDRKTDEKILQALSAQQQQQNSQAEYQDFWFGPRGFYAMNPDIPAVYHDTIWRFFGSVPSHVVNSSARANVAAEWFRQQRESDRETQREQERRKTQQASSVSTGTGGGAADFPRQFNQGAAEFNSEARAAAYQALRQKQMAGTQSLQKRKVA